MQKISSNNNFLIVILLFHFRVAILTTFVSSEDNAIGGQYLISHLMVILCEFMRVYVSLCESMRVRTCKLSMRSELALTTFCASFDYPWFQADC